MKKPMLSLLLCVSVIASAPVVYAERGHSWQDRKLLDEYSKKSRDNNKSRSRKNTGAAPQRKQANPNKFRKNAPVKKHIITKKKFVAPRPKIHRPPVRNPRTFRAPSHRPPVWNSPRIHKAPPHRPPIHKAPIRSGNIYERKANMQRRIRRGLQTGELTHSEARDLRIELNRVDRHLKNYRSDGRLGHRETNQLNYELDSVDRHIRRKMNNNLYQPQYRFHRR